MRSSLFSTMPHGAMPMAQTFPLDFEEWSLRASPTCRITPETQRKTDENGSNATSPKCGRVPVCYTCADPPSEDPGPGGHGRLDKAFSKDLLEFWRQIKVLQASVHRDEQSGKLQLPVLDHQVEQVVRFGVKGDPYVLQKRREGRQGFSRKPNSSNFQIVQQVSRPWPC